MSLHIETKIVEKGTDTLQLAREEHAKDMHQIGSGLYSFVYGSEGTPYVVKTFRGHDKGYRSYIQTICELGDLGQASRYFPKIYKAFLYRHADETYTDGCITPGYGFNDTMVVYLERLEGIDTPYVNPQEEDYRLRRKCTLARFANKISSLLDNATAESLDWSKLRPVHQDLVSLIMLAYEKNKKAGFDIHYGNVMKRGRQIVVTDPLSVG